MGRECNISNPSQRNSVHDHQPHPVLLLAASSVSSALPSTATYAGITRSRLATSTSADRTSSTAEGWLRTVRSLRGKCRLQIQKGRETRPATFGAPEMGICLALTRWKKGLQSPSYRSSNPDWTRYSGADGRAQLLLSVTSCLSSTAAAVACFLGSWAGYTGKNMMCY